MIEPLESRIAPALTVFSLHGTLFISGDPTTDKITISDLPDGKIQIMDTGLFTPLGGIKAIKVSFGATNEEVVLNYANGFAGSTSINLGGGSNNVSLLANAAGNITISGSTGNDTITVPAGITIGGGLTVKAGDGLNTFDLRGTVSGNVSYTGGIDSDVVTLFAGSSVGRNLMTKLGEGVNQLDLRSSVGGNVTYTGGSGADSVLLPDGATVAGNFNAKLGNGNNGATLGGDVTGTLTVTGGTGGSELVSILPTASAKSLTVSLKAGTNQAIVGGTFTGNVKVIGGAEDDFVTVSDGLIVGGNAIFSLSNGTNTFNGAGTPGAALAAITGNLSITTGSGDDAVQLRGIGVTGIATVKLGAGGNIFEIARRGLAVEETSFTAKSLLFVSAGGSDTVTIGSSMSTVMTFGTFNLGSGDDFMSYTGTSAVFTTKLTVNGGKGDDSFTPQAVVAALTPKFISIENLT